MPQALVTGANRGIGLALCAELIQMGWTVTGTSRQQSSDLEELGAQQVRLDLASDGSIHEAARGLEGTLLDLLVHNAGVSIKDELDNLDPEALLHQYRVNTLGPLLLTQALRESLPRGAKVVLLSSRMGSLSDNQTGRQYGYRASKSALNMVGVNLSRDLAPDGIAVGILHPGFVRTDMTGGRGVSTPVDAARGIVARIEELSLASSGSFWHADGRALPW